MAEMTVSAEARSGFGSGAAKRIRRAGRVPAIVYGGSDDNVTVSVDPKAIIRLLRSEAGRNTIVSLQVEGGSTNSVILKDWQVDPVREDILHADFQRIAMDQTLRVSIPVAIRGEAIGVKTEGGMLDVVLRAINVECLPADIPERIDCDVSELDMNESIRVKDLQFSAKVEVLEDAERVVVHVVAVKEEEEEVPEEEVAIEGAEAAAEGEEGGVDAAEKGKQGEEGGE